MRIIKSNIMHPEASKDTFFEIGDLAYCESRERYVFLYKFKPEREADVDQEWARRQDEAAEER